MADATQASTQTTFRAVPVLRIFDLDKAREFYVDYLGFKVDWEHRFGDDFPVYMQVSRDDLVFHLSEHYGDGSPGVAVLIYTTGIEAFHAELKEKHYKYARPGLENSEDLNAKTVTITDPFGNKLRFHHRNEAT
jgi:catechol 2,3-dioxygenase-like lactoylglutathione lyase family enzyme